MNFSLNNLNKSIDRLIKNRLANAIDENYLKKELISEHEFILKHTDKKSKPYQAYEKVYHYYRLGNFHEINEILNSDFFFLECMNSDLIEALVKDKKIKEITSSNKHVNSNKKNIENKNPKKNIIALESGIEEPSFVSPPPPLKQYVIVDNTLKNEIFRGCKWYIKTREIYRKLAGEIFPNTIVNKKILTNKTKEETTSEKNNFRESIIDHYFNDLLEYDIINKQDYTLIKESLLSFFEKKQYTVKNAFFVKNRNKKNLGRALGGIYKKLFNNTISFEYLQLCKNLFVCYSHEIIDKKPSTKTNLYKYLIDKTQ